MRWILFILIYILVDIYAFQAVRTLTKSPWVLWFYFLISIVVLAGLFYELSFAGSGKMMQPPKIYFFGIFLAVRSEERRVGKECRSRWSSYNEKKKGSEMETNAALYLV